MIALNDQYAAEQNSAEEQRLRSELSDAENVLADFRAELDEVNAQWQAVADKRERYEPLETACRSIEKLTEAGLSREFWGSRATDDEVVAHLEEVRGRIQAVAGELVGIDERREEIRKRFRRQLDTVALIEGDLIQAMEAEERRLQEWVVEREESRLAQRAQILPWSRKLEDDQRFRKSLLASVMVSVLLGLLIPWIDIPIPEKEQIEEVPERFARLIRKEPLRPMPEPQAVREPKVEEKPQEVKPEEKPKPKPETQVAQKAQPEVAPEAPRDRVASAGLLAFRESFSNLASSRPSAKLGSDARVSNAGDKAVGMPQRSMVATSGPGSSGGINLASLSRDVGGGGTGEQIEGVALSRVASSIGASGGSDRPLSSGAAAGRTDEEIQIVFDRYKAALYRLYNRELRNDPTLRGQMVLKLTIEPDGTVSVCQLQSSDMNAPLLADQVVSRVLGFDFGAKDVPAITILYPIDFLPAS